jgi:hypothetical protein
MKTNQVVIDSNNKINPNVDDSAKPDYKVSYINKSTHKIGNCTFFSYGHGVQLVKGVFKTLYPEYSILKIIAVTQN